MRNKSGIICPKTGKAVSTAFVDFKCRCEVCKAWRKESVRLTYLKRRDKIFKSRKEYPEMHYSYYLKANYGITIEQYFELLKGQNYGCAICGSKTPTAYKNKKVIHFFVDHDHKTGIIRGLLCDDCNLALGRLKESPSLFRKAANYLEMNTVDKISGENTRSKTLTNQNSK